MFDIAWSELALIGAVALIVIGPKDLPKVMRTAGQWTRKARLLAGEFQHSMDEMVRQAELDDLRKQVQSVNPAAVKFGDMVQDAVKSVTDPLSAAPTPAAPATEPVVNQDVAPESAPPAVEPVPPSAPVGEILIETPKDGVPVAAAPEGKTR